MDKDLKGKVIELEKKYEQMVKEEPLKHAAIALGVGVAVGLIAAALINRKC